MKKLVVSFGALIFAFFLGMQTKAIELAPNPNFESRQQKNYIKVLAEDAASRYKLQPDSLFGSIDFDQYKIYIIFARIKQNKEECIKSKIKFDESGVINLYIEESLLYEYHSNEEFYARFSSLFVHEFSHIYDIIKDPRSPYREIKELYKSFEQTFFSSAISERDSILKSYISQVKNNRKRIEDYLNEEKWSGRSERRAYENELNFIDEKIRSSEYAKEDYLKIREEVISYLKEHFSKEINR